MDSNKKTCKTWKDVVVSSNTTTSPASLLSEHPVLLTCNNTVLLADGYGVRSVFNALDEKRIFGLTWDTSNVYISALNSVRKINAAGESMACYEEYPYDSHQIVFNSGYLYSTITANDEVIALNTDLKPVAIFSAIGKDRLPGVSIYEASYDKHHVNSVWSDGASVWATCHNLKDPSFILELQHNGRRLDKVRSVELQASYAHNAYVEGKFLYACNSKEGKITRCSLDDSVLEHISIDPLKFGAPSGTNFLRGIARFEGGWYVGASGRASREERPYVTSWLFAVDNDFAPTAGFEVPFGCSIYDVRLIAEDKAHNGLAFPFDLGDVL
jgi:hypothetical protein